MKRLALAAVLTATLAGVTSCADDARTMEQPSGSSTSAPAPDLPGLPPFSVGPSGIADDVTTTACPSDQGGAVTATGSATNAGQFQRDLVVVVTWVDTGRREPVARAIAELADVPPGESRDWSADAELDRAGLACTVASYAGQLG